MINQNEMSPAELHAYLAQQNSSSGKIKTRLIAPKKHADTITAEQYRAEYVDQNEHALQARCVEWFRMQYPNLLLFAVPNAALRSYALAAMMKAESLVAGIPDLVLAYPSGEYHGFFIEMKTTRKGSKPSDSQIQVHAYLRSVGYAVAIPTTFEEFQRVVTDYLHGY